MDTVTDWTTPPQPVAPSQWRFAASRRFPPDDLIAVGADLEPGTIIAAYRHGLFPMPVGDEPGLIGWWSPDPRGVIPVDGLRVTRSMRQSARRYQVRIDTAFEAVMRACAAPTREHGWINEEFIAAYTRLHQMGWAHSFETFTTDGTLAGGLYGIRIGRFFAGESMFSLQRDASKAALMALVALMGAEGMTLLDVQWCTEHLASLGAIELPRRDYLDLLGQAVS